MKLIVQEIATSVSQKLRPYRNVQIEAIRPCIYVHNKPAGALKVTVSTTDGLLIAESSEVNISDMTTLPYFHGYVRFDVSAHLKRDVEYMVSVVAGSGYTFSESGYVGVCNDFDARKYETDTNVAHPRNAPLDLEVWSLSLK